MINVKSSKVYYCSALAISLTRNCSALRQEAWISYSEPPLHFREGPIRRTRRMPTNQISVESGDPQTRARRRSGELVSRQKAEALEALLKARTRYFQNQPANSQEEKDRGELWLEENCTSKAEKVFTAYEDLQEQALEPGALYKQTLLQEKRDIV